MTEYTLIVLALAIAMIAVEFFGVGRRWPKVEGWLPRALLLNAGQAGIVFVTGVTCFASGMRPGWAWFPARCSATS